MAKRTNNYPQKLHWNQKLSKTDLTKNWR